MTKEKIGLKYSLARVVCYIAFIKTLLAKFAKHSFAKSEKNVDLYLP